MQNHKELEINLWNIADELRTQNIREANYYVLGLIFYKFLSEKLMIHNNQEYEAEEDKAKKTLGYYIKPELRFDELAINAKNGLKVIDDLRLAFEIIENSSRGEVSEKAFKNIFDGMDLESRNLGKTEVDRNFIVSRIIIKLDTKINNYGKLFEYLIDEYSLITGKREENFHTPKQVAQALNKIVTADRDHIGSAYDPTCGFGSLLVSFSEQIKVDKLYGQEIDSKAYNIARMNLIIHNIDYEDFDIQHGDSLENPKHLMKKFEAIVSNPPFSIHWSPSDEIRTDERFISYDKLAPSLRADYAFIQHMIYHLNEENGVMASIVPLGLLFRGGAEGAIRKNLIKEKNYLDAVIGLPTNIFYETSIQTAILVFKKSRKDYDGILFIDASKHFEKSRPYNILGENDIREIIDAYKERKDIEMFAHVASLKEIQDNDYNLNIPRYVDSFKEEPINKSNITKELKKIRKEIKEVNYGIIKCCKELGIEIPIFLEG